MTIKNKITVIIPYYSKFEWLEEALESLRAQTFRSFEVIIVNDGSSDDLSCLLLKKEYFFDLKIINQKNKGPAAARNKGILKARTKYLAFLDSDDLWTSKKLELQYNFMEKTKSFWSQHSYNYFYENGTKKSINTNVYNGNVFIDTFVSFKVQTSCVMVRRDALYENDKLNIKFKEDQRYGQDLFFYRELALKYELDYLDEYLTLFRIRNNNAGFKPSVQLYSKANTWFYMKNDSNTKLIPPIVKFSYWICWKNYNLLKKLCKKNINEKFAGLLYLVPYLLLKSYNFTRKYGSI